MQYLFFEYILKTYIFEFFALYNRYFRFCITVATCCLFAAANNGQAKYQTDIISARDCGNIYLNLSERRGPPQSILLFPILDKLRRHIPGRYQFALKFK